MVDIFTEADLHVALITETWIKTNFDRIKEDIVMNHGLDIIAYNRPGTKRGGGVAIVFDPKYVKLEENKFKREGAEIISAKGRIIGDTRKLVIYSIYLPPNLKRAKVERINELVNEDITRMKTEYEEPIIILGGDFNQFGIDDCHKDIIDIETIKSPATRAGARIDLIASNINKYVVKTTTLDPLQNSESSSDHNPLLCCFVQQKWENRKMVRHEES